MNRKPWSNPSAEVEEPDEGICKNCGNWITFFSFDILWKSATGWTCLGPNTFHEPMDAFSRMVYDNEQMVD